MGDAKSWQEALADSYTSLTNLTRLGDEIHLGAALPIAKMRRR